ncbi:TonB-dependent receptor [Sphingobium sp. TB-6]|uniref:TonB-dependent receptor n=1 Tax=Sphingobium sp. TB-6 TaxID=2728850 RepID=UPI00146C1FDB|nr:TonB-dependent receptor [Sphingobium sp. TB-6]NML90661.1 TonB-dependent receptor [Sphingobium sp. TB-6]
MGGHRVCSIGMVVTLAVATPVWAQAQAPQDQAPVQGEIFVTAQKRAQRLQDVGISVSALGQSELAAVGRQDVTAIATLVPGVQVNQFSPTATVFNIRGVSQNDFADSQEAPIAFYNDEAYVGLLGAISGQNFDLERVEVLRGPQGTLFGRNATGGLIQVVTAKPTSHLDGFLTLTGGSDSQFATEGAISGPISDTVRGRIAFTTDRRNGYVKNALGRDLGGTRFYAGRAQLAADVGGGTLLVKAQILRNDHDSGAGAYTAAVSAVNADGLGRFVGPNEDVYGTCAGCNSFGYRPPASPRRVEEDHRSDFDRTYWTGSARYEHDLGAVTLTSITDYQSLRKGYTEDSDVSPVNFFTYLARQKAHQVSQELRLSGTGSRITWVAGLYGIEIKSTTAYRIELPSFGVETNFGGVLKTKSVAAFGQLEYKVNPFLSVIGGFRYSYDDKKYDFFQVETGSLPLLFNKANYPDLAHRNFDNYSGKVEIDIKPTDDVLLYASVNRGTKAGGFGTPAFQPIDPSSIPFDEEVLTNFEGGAKLTLLDRKAHLNAAAFHYRYRGYQAFTLVGLTQAIVNNNARVNGFEVDADIRPVQGLYLQAFLTYLDAKVFDITLPSGRIADRRMPQAPRLSFGGTMRYEAEIGSGTLTLQTDWKRNGTSYFTAFNAPVDREPAYWVGNGRVSYRFNDSGFEIAAFVNNITDKTYRIYNLDVTNPVGITQQTFARPRWVGASLTYRIQ